MRFEEVFKLRHDQLRFGIKPPRKHEQLSFVSSGAAKVKVASQQIRVPGSRLKLTQICLTNKHNNVHLRQKRGENVTAKRTQNS